MSEENQSTETQENDGGSQVTLESLQAQMENMQKENAGLREDLDRERRVNQLLDDVEKTPSIQESYKQEEMVSFTGDDEIDRKINQKFNEQRQAIWKQSQAIAEQTVSQYQAVNKIERMYYEKYPQHRGWEDIVNRASENFARDMGARIDSVPLSKRMEEVATRVNKDISNMKERLNTKTLHVEGGSSEVNIPQKETVSKAATAEEKTAAYMEERRNFIKNKSL